MTKRIWAVGASVRALAQSLQRSGFEPICADQFCDLDLQRAFPATRLASYPDDLLRLVDSVEADAWLYTGGLENCPDLIDALAQRLPLWGNAGQVLRRVRDVRQLSQSLAQAGLAMPELAFEPPRDNADAWLRKSQRSSGGLKVAKCPCHGRPLQAGEYYQRFIAGTCYGAAFVAASGEATLLGVTRQLSGTAWTLAPGFQYSGSMGPIVLPDRLHDEIQRLGCRVAREFNLRGWLGIDFLVDDQQQLFVLEVNPRYTASIEVLERATGQPTAIFHAEAFGQPRFRPAHSQRPARMVGKAVLYADRTNAKAKVSSDDLMQRVSNSNDLADIPEATHGFNKGQPILTVFAEGTSEANVEQALRNKAAELYGQLGMA